MVAATTRMSPRRLRVTVSKAMLLDLDTSGRMDSMTIAEAATIGGQANGLARLVHGRNGCRAVGNGTIADTGCTADTGGSPCFIGVTIRGS